MKRFSIILAMLLVLALAVPTFANPFTDVPANHWAYEAVNKLVAAGIISGYSDGTYKGQKNLTRYEIAVVVARALDNIASEREALADELDSAKAGLTAAQAQDVTAIVKTLMVKNQPKKVAEGLTDQQAKEVASLVEALTFEYKAELKVLGANVDAVKTDVAGLDARVAALESKTPTVSFSGDYSVDFKHQTVEGAVERDVDYYWFNDSKVDPSTATKDMAEVEYDGDPYVYSDPWDDDSDEIEDLNGDKKLEQTLNFVTHIAKDGFKADIDLDVEDDDDEYEIDSASLTVENEAIKAEYNEENEVALKDYAFNDADEVNGATLNFKKYGVKAFFGEEDVTVDVKTPVTDTQKVTLKDGPKVEADVVKYEWKDGKFVPVTEDEVPFYVYGAQKTFKVAGMDLNTTFAGRKAKEDDSKFDTKEVNILGVDTITELAGLDLNLDFAYSMPELGDDGYLVRFGVAKDLDLAGLEFNYKNIDENFKPIDQDDVVFDSDDDDYDLYTTGLANAATDTQGVKSTSGWNFTVKPHLMDNLTTSIFYASVDNGVDNTKLALNAEMPFLLDGLTVNGKYETTKEDTDEEKTAGFGAEYIFLADKATATFDYENVDPVEASEGKDEKTIELGVKYAVTDHISANFNHENVSNVDFETKDKVTNSFGVDLADYQLFDAVTANAGFSLENVGKDFDEKTTKYNLGLAYALGDADLSYDYAYTKKDGDVEDEPGEGDYTTNKAGLVYNITDDIDFIADYEILKLDAKSKNYEVKTATAGVSIDF